MQVNDIFNKNLEALRQADFIFYEKMIQYISDRQEQDGTVQMAYLDNGEAVLSIEQNNRIWYMNSRYSDEVFKETWCEQFEHASYLSPYIIFGFGTGSFIRKLNEKLTESNVVLVIEPNPEVFLTVLRSVDISDIIMEQKIILVVKGINEEYIVSFMNHILNYGRMRTVEYGVLPNYLALYRKEWNNLRAAIKETCEREVLNRNTSIVYAKEFATNIFANMMDLPKQYTVNQLKEVCDKKDISDVPAIIVSAGPSLDKNIQDLKQAEGKAFIIATDSALKPLLRNGIKPDVAVTLDPHKPPMLFLHTDALSIPLVVCCVSNKKLWAVHKGKRFYFSEGNTFIDDIYKTYGNITLQPLDTGGSVANNCFSVARYLGFQKIILIGQDLAYPENKRHAFAVYDKVDEAEKHREYVEVEDIYGNMVITDYNMESYLRWFEGQLVLYPEVKVMDATEGGAKIQGTEIITLKDAIARECKREVCFKEDIEQLRPFFLQEVQERIYEFYDEMPKNLNDLKRTFETGKKDYDEILKIYRTKGTNTKEYQKLVKKIGKLTKQIEELPILALVEIYNQVEKYQVLADAYVVKEELEDEVVAIVNSGKKMLKSYEMAIDEFLEHYEKRYEIDMENALRCIKGTYDFAVEFFKCIKNNVWDEMNKKLGLLALYATVILDWIQCMNASGDWKLNECETELYIQIINLLQAQEEQDHHLSEQIIEQSYVPMMKHLIEVIELKNNGQMGSQGV